MSWNVSFARAKAEAFRPPAVPLITCDPYLSVWSFNDRLNDADTHHWTGKPHTLLSLVRIDGKPYRLVGAQPSGIPPLDQTGMTVLPTRTIYTFAGGGVRLTLTFTTPMLPDALDVLTRPAKDDTRFPRPVRDGLPSAAVMVDLGSVSDQGAAAHAIVAYDDLFSIQYMRKNLRSYWRRSGMDAGKLLQTAAKDYDSLGER